MGKLHEVLAVSSDLETVASKVLEEGVDTFKKRTDHFLGNLKRLEMFDEARKVEEAAFNESKEIVTTVQDKLNYVSANLIKFLDVVAQKETANQDAKADVVLEDGTKILEGVPATLLLALESKLAKFRALYEAIPTLQPGVKWIPEPDKGEGVYRADQDEIRHKTEKVVMHKVLYDATDKHPAQIKEWSEDRPIGQFVNVKWSGMITPARKSVMLSRIDELIKSVKKARTRANEQEVKSVDVGKRLFNYIHS
jgi:hypothetical protein